MNKKGSMELSVNSIVILVIAIVMLGLILGFVKSKFSEVSVGLDLKEPDAAPASSSNPVSLSRNEISINAGKEAVLKMSIYNPGISATEAISPTLSCTTEGILGNTPTGNPKVIKAAESQQFSLVLKILAAAPAGTYLCSITSGITDTQPQDVTIKVIR